MAKTQSAAGNHPQGAGRAGRVESRAGTHRDDAAAQLDPGTDSSDHIYPEDIDEWAERLDVTREQLRVAIRQVGSRVDDVARLLGNPDVR